MNKSKLRKILEERRKRWNPSRHTFENRLEAAFAIVEGADLSNKLRSAGVPHAIVGGFASIHFGSPRTTRDIDYIVRSEDLERAVDVFDPLDTQELTGVNGQPLNGVSLTTQDGHPVDIIASDDPWIDDALSSAIDTPSGRMISPPFLILMKLISSRGAQEDMDMAHVVKNNPKYIKEIKRVVKRYLSSHLDDLDSIISISELL